MPNSNKTQKSNKSKATKPRIAKPTARRLATSNSRRSMTAQSGSKHDQILGLLRRKQGASLEEMQKTCGWQAHSVRGFLAGTVKKRLGLKLNSERRDGGGRRYTIVVA